MNPLIDVEGEGTCGRGGGWPQTQRADFDQQFIARLAAVEPPGDPTTIASPSYVFRWASTGAPHCQGLMSSPENADWYERYSIADESRISEFNPELDDETQFLMRWAVNISLHALPT